MAGKLIRVGTTYLPVEDVGRASVFYVEKLDAKLSFKDEDKAIVNFADQSFFLVKAKANERANFEDFNGNNRFSITFEVDGLPALKGLHKELMEREVKVGDIEDRGHSGRNFIFYDVDGNIFDVWSELSPAFKERNK